MEKLKIVHFKIYLPQQIIKGKPSPVEPFSNMRALEYQVVTNLLAEFVLKVKILKWKINETGQMHLSKYKALLLKIPHQ